MDEKKLLKMIREAVMVQGIQPELLRLKDVAVMLSVSMPIVSRLVKAGKIPFYVMNGMKRYKRSDVMAYIGTLEKGKV